MLSMFGEAEAGGLGIASITAVQNRNIQGGVKPIASPLKRDIQMFPPPSGSGQWTRATID